MTDEHEAVIAEWVKYLRIERMPQRINDMLDIVTFGHPKVVKMARGERVGLSRGRLTSARPRCPIRRPPLCTRSGASRTNSARPPRAPRRSGRSD